jgi:putative colanic acid biosysnthesis UDP-glucose lipid carrier transferase
MITPRSDCEIPLDRPVNKLLKRLFDVVFSLLAIILLLSWFLPLMAVIIRLESKGCPFFTQLRTGYKNKTFKCYKIRSMKINDEADSRQATDNDERVTRVGRLIRRFNIDELPQFFNVLFGQMSVVGPRPHMLSHTDYYAPLINNYMERHRVRPGITGLAQVIGLHGETKQLWQMEERVNKDRDYLQHWSFWLDVRIILNTLFLTWYIKNLLKSSLNNKISRDDRFFLLIKVVSLFTTPKQTGNIRRYERQKV